MGHWIQAIVHRLAKQAYQQDFALKIIDEPFFHGIQNRHGVYLASYTIIKDHGDTIEVQSQKGKETFMTITFPIDYADS